MTPAPLLPAAVRARVVGLASERLRDLAEELVPAAVRPYRRFAPRKRAALAAAPLAAALEADAPFRQLVAELVPAEVAAAVREGRLLPAAPEESAAAAYLLRPDGWQDLVAQVAADLHAAEQAAAGAAEVHAVARLTEQLEAVRAQARAETARLTEERDAARSEAAGLQRRVREAGSRAAAAERALAAAAVPAPAVQDDDPGEVRRLTARLRAAEQALAEARTAARSSARDDKHTEQVRLRVLLDALLGAAGGLRRELALPPLDERPADAVAADLVAADPSAVPVAGPRVQDAALLDALLLAPTAHLLVDGYNVTKTGYPEVTLEQQRARLVAGLAALAARTGAEVTVVFDAAAADAARTVLAAPRTVRVLFSPAGVIADDVLRDLVAAEPQGRPLLVVSDDREVAGDTTRLGARAVTSRALLVLLDR